MNNLELPDPDGCLRLCNPDLMENKHFDWLNSPPVIAIMQETKTNSTK